MQLFFYKITDLHALATRESVYALDSLEAEANPELTDRHLLGQDDANFFKRMAKVACAEVFKRVHRRSRGVENAFQFDAEYEGTPGYIIFALDFPDNFDTNLIPSVDSAFQESIIYNVLKGWFSKQRRNYLAEEYEKFYMNTADELKALIEMRTQVERPSVFYARYC